MGKHSLSARARSSELGVRLQVAHLFLCCCGLLELCWRRHFWLSDQSARCLVLHARAEHHTSAWAHRAFRRLWIARSRSHALLFAGLETGDRVEREAAGICLLER